MFGMRSVRIGRLFGIDIEIHASWLIIFALVFLQLSLGAFPAMRGAEQPGVIDLVTGLITTLLFFGSVVVHELSHSLVGRVYGIEVKRITLFIFGGLAHMTQEASEPKAEFLMAVAGPAASLALAFVFGMLDAALRVLGIAPALWAPLGYLAFINVALAVFNLLPGFPLDGGRLLRATLWLVFKDMAKATRIATRAGQLIAALFIAGGIYLAIFGGSDVRFSGFWMALIGFFLYTAASGSYQQMAIGQALAGVSVAQIMTSELVTAPADMPLDRLVEEYFLRYRHGRFPLVAGDELVGTITLQDVRTLDQGRWPDTPARAIAAELGPDDFIGPGEQALTVLVRMAEQDTGQLLVRDGDRVVGIVTKSDVMAAIRIRDYLKDR